MYYLSKYVNISLTESSQLPDFEREVYVNMLVEEMEKEAESYK